MKVEKATNVPATTSLCVHDSRTLVPFEDLICYDPSIRE